MIAASVAAMVAVTNCINSRAVYVAPTVAAAKCQLCKFESIITLEVLYDVCNYLFLFIHTF